MSAPVAEPQAQNPGYGHDGYANGVNGAGGAPVAGGHHGPGHGQSHLAPSAGHQSMVSQVYNPVVGKIGNPGPLGLISFGLTTFVLGIYQAGAALPGANPLGDVGPNQAVFGLAVFYGGAAQFVAGVLEFFVGNTFGTTVHCSYGAFWLAFAMFLVPSLGIKEAYANDEYAYTVHVGVFLFLWFVLTCVFILAALRTNIAILTVLGFLALAFLLLSIGNFVAAHHATAATRVTRAGGVFAIFSAAAAFYAGAAGLMMPSTTMISFPLGTFASPVKEKSKV